jgi:hypothetical protein
VFAIRRLPRAILAAISALIELQRANEFGKR